MIYSKSAEYAIRASIHLARLPDGQCVMAKEIAREEEIPAPFLAKILQELARKGFLRSVKGPSGGFSLKKKASELCLLDIVDAVDGSGHFARCVAGDADCSKRQPCPLHDSWTPVHSRIMDYLGRSTISSLVKPPKIMKAAKHPKRARESKRA
jgi:Rrf2 family iron-sulfur cluster assembly transcriptional regulator